MSNLFNDIRKNEISYMVQMGWLVAGTAPGTHKLSAKGLAEVDRIVESMNSKEKALLKLKLGNNADADLNTLI